jgi:hypothetical protein
MELIHLAWNCLVSVLKNHPTWVIHGDYLRQLEIDLQASAKTARRPLTPAMPLGAVEAAGLPSGFKTEAPNVLMTLNDMPKGVRDFVAPFIADPTSKANRLLLLDGPSGSGKTVIASNIAGVLKAFAFEAGEQFRQQFYGQSANSVKPYFQAVNSYARSHNRLAVVFIDEIETIISARSANHDTERERDTVTAEFLKVMNSKSADFSHLIVVGATNHPTKIDGSMLTRFLAKVHIPLPTAVEMERALRTTLGTHPGLKPTDYSHLANLCLGVNLREATDWVDPNSGADLDHLRAKVLAARCANTHNIRSPFNSARGFTSEITIPAFQSKYDSGNARRFFHVANRTWAFEARPTEDDRHAGLRLHLLQGAPVTHRNMGLELRNHNGTVNYKGELYPLVGPGNTQLWYLGWKTMPLALRPSIVIRPKITRPTTLLCATAVAMPLTPASCYLKIHPHRCCVEPYNCTFSQRQSRRPGLVKTPVPPR